MSRLTEQATSPQQDGLSWRWTLAIVLTALVVRLLVLGVIVRHPERAYTLGASDTSQYLTLARNLVEQGTFSARSQPPFTPDFLRTPGYPALLTIPYLICGGECPVLIVLLNVLMGSTITGLVVWLGARIGGARVGRAAGWLYALAPASVMFTGFILTETFFGLLLVLAAAALLIALNRGRWWLYWLAGGLMGLAALTRPIALPAAFVLLFPIALSNRWRHAILFGLAFLIGLAAVTAPWFYRNYRQFGTVTLSKVGGHDLFVYMVGSMEAYRLDISYEESKQLLYEEMWALKAADAAAGLPVKREVQYQSAVSMAHIAAHPVAFVVSQTLDLTNSLRPGFSTAIHLFRGSIEEPLPLETLLNLDLHGAVDRVFGATPLLAAIQVYLLLHLGVFLVLFLVGALQLVRLRQWSLVFLLVLYPGWMLYMAGIASGARFRAPTEPFLALAAAFGFEALWQLRGRLRARRARQPSLRRTAGGG